LTEGQIHHQYRKLERHGLIEIERSDIPSQSGARMKIAVIPEDKLQEVKSLVSHDRQPERTSVDVVELAEKLDELQATLEETQKYVTTNLYERMEQNTERLEALESAEGSHE
jgi:hypothetical protein